jgi:NADP-dependent 3-hydroxy acid dehydrogenase YdfG
MSTSGSSGCSWVLEAEAETELWCLQARGRKVNLRVTEVSPGLVETEFATVHAFGKDAEAKEKYKQMKALQAGDVAQAVVYCLSAPDHVDTNDILMRPVEQQT